ncbi:MAG: hypothetical protein NTW03_15275 [Verrucomicrobia bacterium]|nr:hypothetical protein [Verrucomicrobiota bacterium]
MCFPGGFDCSGKLKQKWAKLTDDDLPFAEGKHDELFLPAEAVGLRWSRLWCGCPRHRGALLCLWRCDP